MKKEARSAILIRKPDGALVQKEIRLGFEDTGGGLFEVEILGDSPLQGYVFMVRQADLKKVRDSGQVVG